jgi:hypothetical protein
MTLRKNLEERDATTVVQDRSQIGESTGRLPGTMLKDHSYQFQATSWRQKSVGLDLPSQHHESRGLAFGHLCAVDLQTKSQSRLLVTRSPQTKALPLPNMSKKRQCNKSLNLLLEYNRAGEPAGLVQSHHLNQIPHKQATSLHGNLSATNPLAPSTRPPAPTPKPPNSSATSRNPSPPNSSPLSSKKWPNPSPPTTTKATSTSSG